MYLQIVDLFNQSQAARTYLNAYIAQTTTLDTVVAALNLLFANTSLFLSQYPDTNPAVQRLLASNNANTLTALGLLTGYNVTILNLVGDMIDRITDNIVFGSQISPSGTFLPPCNNPSI